MEWDTRSIVYISFEAIAGFITVIGNSIVLIAIIKTRQLHTVTNVFIGSLAIADIFVGIAVAPLAALSFLGVPADVYGCIFINSAILMFTNVSILMLLGVAVERFVAIRLPYAYDRLMTIRGALYANGFIWVLGTLLGLIPMYGWNIAPNKIDTCAFVKVISMEYMIYFQFFGLVALPIIIMFAIYTYILCVIRKHTKQTDALQNMFNKDRRSRKRWKKDVRAAKSFALLIVLFAIFWLPVNILNSLTLFCPTCKTPFDLLLAAIVMSHANSSINPLLYAASNSRIQTSIMALFCKRRAVEETSIDMPSGIDPHSRGASIPQLNRSISVIAANKIEYVQNDLRLGSPPTLPQKRRDSPLPELDQLLPALLAIDNNTSGEAFKPADPTEASARSPVIEDAQNDIRLGSPPTLPQKRSGSPSPELNQLLPSLLSLHNNTSNEAITPADPTEASAHSPVNRLEAHDAEAMALVNGSTNQLSHDKRRFSDGQVNIPDDQKNDTETLTKYTSDYIPNQKTSYQPNVAATPIITPERISGHVNFAFIDDTTISGDTSASPSTRRKYVSKSDHNDNKREAEDASEENLPLNENGTKLSEEDTKNRILVSSNYTEMVGSLKGTRKSAGSIDHSHGKEFGKYSPIRGIEFFEMVDEPEDDQECGQMFMVGETGNNGFAHVNESGQGKINGMHSVTHSYFRTHPKTKTNNNITDVEINSNQIFIHSESQQTKL